MDIQIALLLAQDGVANGAIYILVALGLVLIFVVTRIIFVPFGDIAAYAALTLASIQLGRTPGTVWVVVVLALMAVVVEAVTLIFRGEYRRLPKAVLCYLILPVAPAALVWALSGRELPTAVAIILAIALVMPISPLLYRIAFRPIADAPVLVLLI